MPIVLFLTILIVGAGGFIVTMIFNMSRRLRIVEDRQRYLERGDIDKLIELDG